MLQFFGSCQSIDQFILKIIHFTKIQNIFSIENVNYWNVYFMSKYLK